MNAQVIKLFAFIVVLFGVLVGFTSYWSVFDAEALQDQRANRRPILESQQIERGRILAADGSVIARSVASGEGQNLTYSRRYPLGTLFGHPIGYSFVDRGEVELEDFYNDELTGEESEFTSIIDELGGGREQGNDVHTTLLPSAQQAAFDALGGQPGSVVAIDPQTGAVRVMVSQPPYDPNQVPENFGQLATDPGSALLDRATQSGYPPGSTMKVVTATAAIDTGEFSPDSTVNGDTGIPIDGVPLSNSGDASFGEIDLTTALTNSVNTVWAQVAESVGDDTYFEYMDRFGFSSDPPIDLPDTDVFASGVYESERRLEAGDPVDIGRVAIGQERLQVSPLQMAQVASAVANGGELMRPHLLDRVTDPENRVVRRYNPDVQSEVMSSETAETVNQMMQDVVSEGTGTAAALSGIDVAGKTGTAEVPGREECGGLPNQAWFIGFAPAEDPQVAIAATVECTSGQGGTVAAPIAATVMQAVLAASE